MVCVPTFDSSLTLLKFCPNFPFPMQGIRGVPPIPNGYNPAAWMLEVTTTAAEERMGEDFAEIYKNSDQYR